MSEQVKYERTGEYREPKAGEAYIGLCGTVLQAKHDTTAGPRDILRILPTPTASASPAPGGGEQGSVSGFTGEVTHEEALNAVIRFTNSHFKQKPREQARISIPADPTRDDDIRLTAYIEQNQSRLAHLTAEVERLKGERDDARRLMGKVSDAVTPWLLRQAQNGNNVLLLASDAVALIVTELNREQMNHRHWREECGKFHASLTTAQAELAEARKELDEGAKEYLALAVELSGVYGRLRDAIGSHDGTAVDLAAVSLITTQAATIEKCVQAGFLDEKGEVRNTGEARAWMVWCPPTDECDYRVFFTEEEAEIFDEECACSDDDADHRTTGVIPLYAASSANGGKP